MTDSTPITPEPKVYQCTTCDRYTVSTAGGGAAMYAGPGVNVVNFSVGMTCGIPGCSGIAEFVDDFVSAVTEHGFQVQATDPAALQFTVDLLLQRARAEGWTTGKFADSVANLDGRFSRFKAWLARDGNGATLAAAVTTPVVLAVLTFLLRQPSASVDDIDRMLREHPPAVTVVIVPPGAPTDSQPDSHVHPSDEPQRDQHTAGEGEQEQEGER